MYDGLRVVDADAHKMENPVTFFDYLDAAYRDRLSSRIDRYGQQRLVIQDFNPATGRNDHGAALGKPVDHAEIDNGMRLRRRNRKPPAPIGVFHHVPSG